MTGMYPPHTHPPRPRTSKCGNGGEAEELLRLREGWHKNKQV